MNLWAQIWVRGWKNYIQITPLYRFRAIILNINKIRDNNTRIVFISHEYGKITGWWNKKDISWVDIWDIVEVLISRDTSKNIIKSIEIIMPGWHKNWNYTRIYSFLETLHLVSKISIDGQDCPQLYNDLLFFIEYGIKQDIDISQYTIFQMRLLKAIGSMNPEMFWDDNILQYIYNNISHTPLEKILSSSKIKDEHVSKIKQINLHSIYMLNK